MVTGLYPTAATMEAAVIILSQTAASATTTVTETTAMISGAASTLLTATATVAAVSTATLAVTAASLYSVPMKDPSLQVPHPARTAAAAEWRHPANLIAASYQVKLIKDKAAHLIIT